jgi:Rrf2 family protein
MLDSSQGSTNSESRAAVQLFTARDALAVTIVVDIAIHERRAPVKAHEIAARLKLAARYFEPVLQSLARAGILASKRGRMGGGYRLGRCVEDISIADILQAALGHRPIIDRGIVSRAIATLDELAWNTLRGVDLASLLKSYTDSAE